MVIFPNIIYIFSMGYIFFILQQFATERCNFTHFKMLFPVRSSCLDQNFVFSWNHPLIHPSGKYVFVYMTSVKVEVKSVLRIGSAHNNVRTSNVNVAQISNFRIFLNINSISYSFRSIANQNGVRYSDSTSYFKKYSSSKCKQTVCLHYGLDSTLKAASQSRKRGSI
jgi:hypothetical protein